jgi:hypothetical protein
MSNKHYAPLFRTFTWLKEHHAIDGKCERVLKMISKRYKRVLVAGNTNSGKNTVANSIFAYWHEIGREATFTPTFECRTPGELWNHSGFRGFRPCFTQNTPIIVPMKYEQEWYGEQFVPGLFASARNFDVIVDCRRLPDGTRMVCQVFCRRGQGWTCLYRSPMFASLQIGARKAA